MAGEVSSLILRGRWFQNKCDLKKKPFFKMGQILERVHLSDLESWLTALIELRSIFPSGYCNNQERQFYFSAGIYHYHYSADNMMEVLCSNYY